ncbi:MAG: CDP-diacylglycerol--glycerol-3-phosphate 3-phosphatidyltransferase [SAR324 cluster bacterium]|uniref:CDP-diacylglycerol--glycerol-3-phosphate 3-phosphatidyltransferase n=1 Tax=SAR324 cluster bacterium TaxID=2024889 RepID=A0A7X9IJA5_9DELT|nr:CDP-diacylglycerol--glycerol-3-phosphate 3-phosphatidyltransferase [SAR324 cluster bacterium]
MASNYIKQIPNWLTYIRLGLVPLFVILLLDSTGGTAKAAGVVFIVAAITDFLDGFIARKMGAESDFGKLMDPLVDKMLVLSALIMLVSLRSLESGNSWVPGWMVVLIVVREIWVTGLRGVAASRGVVVPAGIWGKLKSALQMVAIPMVLFYDVEISLLGLNLTSQVWGLNLLLVSIVCSYIGAYEYTASILFPEETSSQEPIQ